ncbi:ras and Rab interactor 2 isoform X1 [Polypterus senegalus]
MEEDPIYDSPDSQQCHPTHTRGSLNRISILDRLILTHPVWLQLSINCATALHILQREPPGSFLVRKSNTSQKKVLCVRLADDTMPSFVRQFTIQTKDSTFSLENSAISFPDLCRLISFYCLSRDVLPFPLILPEAIAKATSHKQLEAISHMGVEFWSSPLNFRGPRSAPSPPDLPPIHPADCCTPQENTTVFNEFCQLHTRSPFELDCGTGQGALCFINPLFLQEQQGKGALLKRNQFKRSFKVRVSTENSSPLSPPAMPPPPPPLLKKEKSSTGRGNPATCSEEDSEYMLPCVAFARKASYNLGDVTGFSKGLPLSPTAEEEDYQMPKILQQESNKDVPEKLPPAIPGDEDLVLMLDQGQAPSLNELDSCSSMSSLEEVEESVERPPLTRGTSSPTLPTPRHRPNMSALRKMSEVLYSFFAPEKRIARLVEDLSRDRRTTFGMLVQDFLTLQRESREEYASSGAMLQAVRGFINEAKSLLLDCGELEPPIETLLPDEDNEFVLEKALYRCILKPLKAHIDIRLRTFHTDDGSLQMMKNSLQMSQEGALKRFEVKVPVPNSHGIERVRQKLTTMQKAYSPIDKIILLLQACKCIYTAMRSGSGSDHGADEFLPALSYVLVQCNMPDLPQQVEYMMELLEPSLLTGEGGYYLTSVYASLCLIQSPPEVQPKCLLTQEMRESIKQWSKRRGTEANNLRATRDSQKFLHVVHTEADTSEVKMVVMKKTDSVESFMEKCAQKFGISEADSYGLFLRSEGDMRQLPLDCHLQDITSQLDSGFSLIYQRYGQDFSKTRKLTRGGAIDLTEQLQSSTC